MSMTQHSRASRAPAAISVSAIPADVFDVAWLASLAAVRRRVLTLVVAGLSLLLLGGWLASAAHARPGALVHAWPQCVAGVASIIAGLALLGRMAYVARALG